MPALPSPATASINSHTRSVSSRSQFTLSTNTSGAIEGWRAVLAVVLRYGMAQKHKEYDVFGQNSETVGEDGSLEARSMEDESVDNVKHMVAGVKQQGGKELLKYVKTLLG